MEKPQFIINPLNLYWINGEKEDPDDLCLHGDVFVKIGEEVVAAEYHCAVSSTALYLLKSLEEDHIPGDNSNQMLPCCGHFIIPHDNEDVVTILGCPNGIDWSVVHLDGCIRLITESGNEVYIDPDSYQETVFAFADKIENFYRICRQKDPADEFERKGYEKFWKEWHNRRYIQISG